MNQKGGVGKTTSVINVGVGLARLGKKVLLVDLDPQANLTSGLGIITNKGEKVEIDNAKRESKSVYDMLVNKDKVSEVFLATRIENLFVIPSGIELSGAEIEMVNMMSRENILKSALLAAYRDYDFIIVDCPPSLGILTINALVAAEKVLVPIQCEYFALEGLGQLMNTIKLVKSNINPALEIGGVVLTMYDSRTNLSKDVADEVRRFFGDKVFDSVIPRNVRLSEAPSFGQSIMEYDSSSAGAKAYENLAKEISERFG